MNIFQKIGDLLNKMNTDTTSTAVVPVEPIVFPNVTADIPTFPDRPEDAKSGSDFSLSILTMAPDQSREDLLYNEITRGNIPDFMKHFVELTVNVGGNTIRYLVSPDYLSVGNDSDFIRTPLNPLTAQKIAKLYGCTLPTRKMVNQIWKAATVKIEPQPNGPPYGTYMQSVDAYVKNNTKIEEKRAGQPLGKLVAGHKKDVVISKALLSYINNVAIYGWFYASGKVIQDLNPVDHNKLYKDYSHGIRLVYQQVFINDKLYNLFDVLKDPTLCNLISDEGAYDATNIYSR